MAYGFQNTCDSDEYFYLDNVPGYVSVNEFYYIVTQEGDIFCGKYVNIPAVDYQIQTYNLVGMTAQTSAPLCNNINPCPDFFIPTSQPVSTTQVNECACLTEYPLGASCVVPNVTPQNQNVTVNLKITGGTAPYSIYSANTETLITNVATNGGTSSIQVLRPSGTYCFDIYDFYQTKISHCCTVNSASTLLTATYLPTNTNQCYNSGSVAVTINGGTPPYTVYRNGVSQGQTTNFVGLGTGIIPFYVTDSSTPMQQTPISNQIITVTPIIYPDNICMTITICNQQFNLTFNRSTTTLCPPTYFCNNAGDIGAVNNIIITGNTNTLEWGSIEVTIDPSQISLPSNCNLLTDTLRFTKSQNTEQPTGSYNIQGAFAAGNSNVTTGACLITPTFTYQVVGTCSGLNQGSITIVPNVSTFIPTLNNAPISQNQAVFPNLAAGNYTLFITSNGTPSSTQTINVPSSANVTSTQTNCEVPISDNQLQSSYTLSATRQYLNIPDGVIVSANVRRRYFLGHSCFNVTDLNNYTFNVISTKIFRNGELIHNITESIGSRNEGSVTTFTPQGCPIRYDRDDDYSPVPTYPITIQNNDTFTFEDVITMTRTSTETLSFNCSEFLRVQTSKILINVTNDSPSCFTFNPTQSIVVNQSAEIRRNCQTNTNTFVFLSTYPSVCPQA